MLRPCFALPPCPAAPRISARGVKKAIQQGARRSFRIFGNFLTG
jgi:hypothetical protein